MEHGLEKGLSGHLESSQHLLGPHCWDWIGHGSKAAPPVERIGCGTTACKRRDWSARRCKIPSLLGDEMFGIHPYHVTRASNDDGAAEVSSYVFSYDFKQRVGACAMIASCNFASLVLGVVVVLVFNCWRTCPQSWSRSYCLLDSSCARVFSNIS